MKEVQIIFHFGSGPIQVEHYCKSSWLAVSSFSYLIFCSGLIYDLDS